MIIAILILLVAALALAVVAGCVLEDFGVALIALGTIAGLLFYAASCFYKRGQIAQASGTNTVQLVKQPNGEMKWEPTTKAGE